MVEGARWVFGKGDAILRAEEEQGEAHFGSRFREAIYGEAYGEAAAVMFEYGQKERRLSELSQPILFLQRHTFELLLKETLESLLQIRTTRSLWHDLLGVGAALEPITKGDRDATVKGHSLQCLHERVTRNLRILGLGTLPEVFRKAVDLIEALEQSDHSRVRYPRDGRGQQSYRSPTVARLGDLNGLLQEALRQCRFRGEQNGDGELTFYESFCVELAHEAEDHYMLIGRLIKMTQDRELPWTPMVAGALQHDTAEIRPYTIATDTEYLRSGEVNGRALVILPLDPPREPSRFAIARLLGNDRLSSLLVLGTDDLYLVRLAAICAGLLDDDGEPGGDP